MKTSNPMIRAVAALTFHAWWLPVPFAHAQEAFKGKIDVIAVGYDIAGNAAAKQNLDDIAKQARKDGANGKVILADKDPGKLEQALSEAFSSATTSPGTDAVKPPPPTPPPAPGLTLRKAKVRSGETIAVTHSDLPVRNVNAWIGFYRVGADHKDYIHYTFLKNLTGRLYDVNAPAEPGPYDFRIFGDEGYTPLAVSPPVVVE